MGRCRRAPHPGPIPGGLVAGRLLWVVTGGPDQPWSFRMRWADALPRRRREPRTPDMVRKSLRGQRWVLASGRRTRSMPGNGLWAAARCSHSLPPACATRVEGRWVVITLTISPLIRPKTPHGFISHQSRGDEPEKHESAGQRAAAAPRPTAMSGPLEPERPQPIVVPDAAFRLPSVQPPRAPGAGLVPELLGARRPRHLKRAESGSARGGGAGANRQPTSHIVNAVFGDCHVSYYLQFLTNY
jgi:hypothetical protein